MTDDLTTRAHWPQRPIVFYGDHTASLSLYVDGLPGYSRHEIRVLTPSNLRSDLVHLASAATVVYVRGFERVARSGLDAALTGLGVPRAWFTDDDLTALQDEEPAFRYYTARRTAGFAGRLNAVVGTTPVLCERLRRFNPTVLYWPCVVDETLVPAAATAPDGGLRIGVIGGAFRRDGLLEMVMPAIEELPGAELVMAAPIAGKLPVRTVPFEADFRRFVLRWRGIRPHIVVHPPGRSNNMAVKGAGTLLACLYIGAVPIVADEPAYAGLGAAEGVLRVTGGAAEWRSALAQLADQYHRAAQFERLAAFCREAFSAQGPEAAIAALRAHANAAGREVEARLATARVANWRPKLSYYVGAALDPAVWRRAIRNR